MSAIVSTLIRYLILAFLLVGGLFLVFSIARQDWMREELSIKMSDLEKINDIMQNVSNKAAFNQMTAQIPKDATIDLKAHFGLKKFTFTITASKFGNPLQLAIPEISWSLDNDVFVTPSKYGIPLPNDALLKKEMKGQQFSSYNYCTRKVGFK